MRRSLWLGFLVLACVVEGGLSRLYADGQAVVAPPATAAAPIIVEPAPGMLVPVPLVERAPASVANPPVVVQSGPITVVNPPVVVVPPPFEFRGPVPVPPSKHHKGGWFTHPVGCASADIGCSNLAAETVFLWGSCREFFTEPCVKQPVPPLLHRFPAIAPPLSCSCP
jgi:hypothetical protein